MLFGIVKDSEVSNYKKLPYYVSAIDFIIIVTLP